MAESGVPGYQSVATFGAFAPARTPVAIVERLNREIVQVITAPDTRERLLQGGIEVIGSSPLQFATFIKADMERTGPVIRASGMRTD
jgi:tripartite-type tricarboxylate transporter receptor subunit TctC